MEADAIPILDSNLDVDESALQHIRFHKNASGSVVYGFYSDGVWCASDTAKPYLRVVSDGKNNNCIV